MPKPTASTAAAATSRLVAVRRRRAARSTTGARGRRGPGRQLEAQPSTSSRRAATAAGIGSVWRASARRRRMRSSSAGESGLSCSSSGREPGARRSSRFLLSVVVRSCGQTCGRVADGSWSGSVSGRPADRGAGHRLGRDRPSGWFPSTAPHAVGSRSPSSSASRARPRKQRDFTVPSAQPSICGDLVDGVALHVDEHQRRALGRGQRVEGGRAPAAGARRPR